MKHKLKNVWLVCETEAREKLVGATGEPVSLCGPPKRIDRPGWLNTAVSGAASMNLADAVQHVGISMVVHIAEVEPVILGGARQGDPHCIELAELLLCTRHPKDGTYTPGPNARKKRDALIEAQENRCFYCGGELAEPQHKLRSASPSLDHIKPRVFGGSNSINNFVISCSRCNGARGLASFRAFRSIRDERIASWPPLMSPRGGKHIGRDLQNLSRFHGWPHSHIRNVIAEGRRVRREM